MTYLCIKPRCSANCSMCSEAVPVPDPVEVEPSGYAQSLVSQCMPFCLEGEKPSDALLRLTSALASAGQTTRHRRLCGYCHTWRTSPCGEGCCWQPNDPTLDEILPTLADLQQDECALTKAYAEGRKDEREAIGAVLKSHGIELRDDINGDVRAVKSET